MCCLQLFFLADFKVYMMHRQMWLLISLDIIVLCNEARENELIIKQVTQVTHVKRSTRELNITQRVWRYINLNSQSHNESYDFRLAFTDSKRHWQRGHKFELICSRCLGIIEICSSKTTRNLSNKHFGMQIILSSSPTYKCTIWICQHVFVSLKIFQTKHQP